MSERVEITNAVLIAGPTASGKSALALEHARRTGGIVVNADSMQVYDVLNVLTARPDAAALAAAPHQLYGHVAPSTAYSTGAWLRDVERLAREGAFAQRPAIFVGGTGLYFKALLGGLSAMPAVPDAIREKWRARLAEDGAGVLHERLSRDDPQAAARIGPADGQRIVRALEILEATGRPIGAWQGETSPPLVDPATATRQIVETDRDVLAKRIDKRLHVMVEQGALDEVRALLALDLEPSLPAMKAIGVAPFSRHVAGEIGLEEAIDLAAAQTRQYAKRQRTWFRGQVDSGWIRVTSETVS